MSIRVTVCALFVLALSIYAYRDWFKALCGALFLLAFLEHPDMPRSIAGIQGLNLWNLLYANILVAWWFSRGREGLVWDMPRLVQFTLALYVLVICVAFVRAFLDPTRFYQADRTTMTVNYLINPLKFLLPCFLLYDGARSRARVIAALAALTSFYVVLSMLIIRAMGFHIDFSGDELGGRAVKVIGKATGYHRVEVSMMLAGASWAVLALSRLAVKTSLRWALWGTAVMVLLAQGLTGGRTGYVTWGVVGLVLCMLKWRKLLPLFPVAVLVLVTLMPGVRERMLSGFGSRGTGPIVTENDTSEITSGRTVVWPYVVAKIKESPLIGYGRLAMVRTGLYEWVAEVLRDAFQHPHNAYLEQLLDGGIIGFLCVIPVYLLGLAKSLTLFRDGSDRLFEAAGGFGLALVLALLVGSMGGQTLYPREGVVGMWAAIGIALRVWVSRRQNRQSRSPHSGEQLAGGVTGDEHVWAAAVGPRN